MIPPLSKGGRQGIMLRIVEAVAVLAAILVYFTAEESRDETTLYPVRCVAGRGGGCELLEPLRRTIYHVVPAASYVVYWSPDSPDSTPAKLGDCAIIDPRNWTCAGRAGGTVRVRDGLGHRGDFGIDQSVFFVRWYQWHFARLLGGIAPFGVPRQFD
jgi:hypothetical protein